MMLVKHPKFHHIFIASINHSQMAGLLLSYPHYVAIKSLRSLRDRHLPGVTQRPMRTTIALMWPEISVRNAQKQRLQDRGTVDFLNYLMIMFLVSFFKTQKCCLAATYPLLHAAIRYLPYLFQPGPLSLVPIPNCHLSLVGGLEHVFFPFSWGISWSQLLLTPWFFRGVGWNHQTVETVPSGNQTCPFENP